jgi:hypothetical protein
MTSARGRRPRRSSGTERIFEDQEGRMWSAGRTITPQGGDAMLFTCISDPREPPRAVFFPADVRLADVPADELRALLDRAPKVGRL